VKTGERLFYLYTNKVNKMYGNDIPVMQKKEPDLKFPADFPEEIKDELLASRCNLSVNLSMNANEQIIGHFSYSYEDDYGNYDKSFNSWKGFEDHAKKFFSIQELYDKQQKGTKK